MLFLGYGWRGFVFVFDLMYMKSVVVFVILFIGCIVFYKDEMVSLKGDINVVVSLIYIFWGY